MKLIINAKEYTNFSSYTIKLKYNAIASTFSFTGYDDFFEGVFDYDSAVIRDNDNNTLLVGNILTPALNSQPEPELKSINGYSTPGKLQDVSIPIDLYPLQFDRLTLNEVAKKILGYFKIVYNIDSAVISDMNKTFEKINDDPGKSPKQLINRLASQRNIILTHNELGEVVFTRIDAEKLPAVFSIDEGDSGIKNMTLKTDARSMHSDITVMREASKDNPDAGQATVINPYVSQKLKRPLVKVLRSGDIFDVEKAARNELSKEIGTISLNINETKFVKPGNVIEVKSKNLNIPKFQRFFVEETTITGDAKEDTEKYALKCVPIDAYSDRKPINIFQK